MSLHRPLPISAAVLAGGVSSRMGRNKAILELGGERLIERVASRLERVAEEVLVVTNTSELFPFLAPRVRFVPDSVGPGEGPLVGIASALAAAQHERLLVVATDMPFLNVELLRHIATVEPQADVVVPVLSSGGHPETLHARYHRRALPAIERRIAAGQRRITCFFEDVSVHTLPPEVLARFDPDHRSFYNANTPEEWAEVEALVTGAPDE